MTNELMAGILVTLGIIGLLKFTWFHTDRMSRRYSKQLSNRKYYLSLKLAKRIDAKRKAKHAFYVRAKPEFKQVGYKLVRTN